MRGIIAILPFIPFLMTDPGFYAVFLNRFAGRFPAHGTGIFAALDKAGLLPAESVNMQVYQIMFVIIIALKMLFYFVK